jgi:hypothetical protein
VTVRSTWVRPRRRLFRRLVLLCPVVGLFFLAPTAVATPPAITVTISGVLGLDGWYQSSVTVDWLVQGETSSSGCDTVTLTAETPGTRITCTADNGGDQTSQSVTIKLDTTPPAAAAAAARVPDVNGWYNQPVTVSSSGTDATSGIASCSSAEYSGPDSAVAVVIGSCADNAGNSAPTSLSFKYDATAPTLSGLRTKPGYRTVDLMWKASSDTQIIEIVRTPGRNGAAQSVVFRGLAATYRDKRLTIGRRYRYRVTAFDDARNTSAQAVAVVATGALLSPEPGERITPNKPPRLTWVAVKRASYYNLQVMRNGKILSVWPARPSFQLRRTWLYKGHRYRLRPGVYHWYVWPGFGRTSAARYGRLLGSSKFVVSG